MDPVGKEMRRLIQKGCQDFGVWNPRACEEAVTERIRENPTRIQQELQTYKTYLSSERTSCMTEAERRLFFRMNHDRYRFRDEFVEYQNDSKLSSPLKLSCPLVRAARQHSQEISTWKDLSHTAPDGTTSSQRISAVVKEALTTGENIGSAGARFYSSSNIEPAQDLFMNYPKGKLRTHRSNVLDPDFTHVGVGVFTSERGITYVTQYFVEAY